MSDATPERTPHRRFFLSILALAFAARVTAWIETAGSPVARILVGDAAHFDNWARDLVHAPLSGWIGGEVFYQAPLYPYFLGTLYSWFGPSPDAARLVQLTLGAIACALVALATRRAFGVHSGWFAGLFCALYGPWIWFDLLIQKASLALFLTAILIERLTARRLTRKDAFTCGLTLGLLVLTRENALILAPLVLIAIVRNARTDKEPQGGKLAGLCLLGLVFTLGPVAWRNAHLGGGFVPTAFNAGVNFYLGNRAEADGRYTALVHGRENPALERIDAVRLAESAAGEELTPAEVSSHWFARGMEDVSDEPLRWIGLLVRKALLVINDHELMDSDALPLWRTESHLLDLTSGVFRFGTLFALACLGIAWQRRRLGHTWFHVASAVALALSLTLFFVTARFRVGLVPFLVPFAAVAIVDLLERPNGRSFVRRARWLALPTVLAFLPVAYPPLSLKGDALPLAWSNLASGALNQVEPEVAQALAERALALDPDHGTATYNLGVAARLSGDDATARKALLRSFELEPSFEADARFQLGLLEAIGGDEAAALPHFRRAAELAPNDPDTRFNYGLVLERLGHPNEARREFEACLQLDPNHERARDRIEP